jgi:hypothetical protein
MLIGSGGNCRVMACTRNIARYVVATFSEVCFIRNLCQAQQISLFWAYLQWIRDALLAEVAQSAVNSRH